MFSYDKKINNSPSFKAKLFNPEIAQENKREFLKYNPIRLYTHISPDQDTVRSNALIHDWLKRMGKNVSICLTKEETKGMRFKSRLYNLQKNTETHDLAILLDFNSLEKAPNDLYEAIEKNSFKEIYGFDHHPQEAGKSIKSNIYYDTTAKACTAIIYRFFEAIGEKLRKKDFINLLYGIVDDYKKELVTISKNNKLIKLPELNNHPNAKEVLEKVENALPKRIKNKIYKNLNIINNMTKKEKRFNEYLYSKTKISSNKEMAYVELLPSDKLWLDVGMDNIRTSEIIRDYRLKLINGICDNSNIPSKIKEDLKNIKYVAVFYKLSNNAESEYQVSITSKSNTSHALDLVNYAKNSSKFKISGGGHPNRVGARIFPQNNNPIQDEEAKVFINDFVTAVEEIGKKQNPSQNQNIFVA